MAAILIGMERHPRRAARPGATLGAALNRGWWTRQHGPPEFLRSLIDCEAKATRVQNYEALFVPGLLQTAEATRAIIVGAAPTVSDVELDNLVAARMAARTARDSKDSTGSVLARPPMPGPLLPPPCAPAIGAAPGAHSTTATPTPAARTRRYDRPHAGRRR